MAGAEVAPVVPLRAPVPGGDELLRLRRAVDLPRLIEAGYDPGARAPHLRLRAVSGGRMPRCYQARRRVQRLRAAV